MIYSREDLLRLLKEFEVLAKFWKANGQSPACTLQLELLINSLKKKV